MKLTEDDMRDLYAQATQLEKDSFAIWDTHERQEEEPRNNWQGWEKIYARVHGTVAQENL